MPKAPTAGKVGKDYLLAKASPQEFIDRHCLIQDENNGTVMRFRLWQYQRDLLQEWIDNRLNVDLKARQLGISWLVCAFALWLVLFYENITVLCISKTQDKAWDMIRKIMFMYDNLPEYLKKPLEKRNQGSVVLEGGSRVIALASTPGSGVGYTATLVIADEWGEQDYAEELYSSFKPTIDMGGRMIGLGTGNSVGSFYHEICTKAQAGENGFHFHFLGWWLRPGRHKYVEGEIVPDMQWYEDTKKGYPNLQEFLRMYPSNPVEAFIAAGGCPFSIEDFAFYEEHYMKEPHKWEYLEDIRAPMKLVEAAKSGELWVWEKPLDGYQYEPFMDVATGKEDGGDYHAIQIVKMSNMEQVAEFQSRLDTDRACEIAIELARWYNSGELAWESTGVGHSATNYFVRSDYPFLYEHEEFNQERAGRRQRHAIPQPRVEKAARLGWPASRTSNAARDADLIAAFRDHTLIIHSSRLLNEMKGFVRQPDGTYAASGRAHDDLVTSMGAANHIAIRRAHRRPGATFKVHSRKKRAFGREKFV